ncbi:MAG TPA: LysE family transporter [Blastocatellia bacterium]|nr:LysE family transporter [Blastocatellia bacterium]
MIWLLQGIALGLSAAVSPGPFQAWLLSQAVKRGLRRALPLVLAPLSSDGPVIMLVLFVLVRMPGWLLRGLYLAGGIFLLYLARGAWLAFRHYDPAAAVRADRENGAFLKGVLINLLSPGPWIYWSVIAGPILLRGRAESHLSALGFIAGFYLTLIGGLAGLTVIFAMASRSKTAAARLLNAASAIALFVFGLLQIRIGITRP